MRLLDLTHSITSDMPVYPGTEQPVITAGCTIEADGFAEKRLEFYSHTGTHIDAPAHILPEGKSLDQLPVSTYMGTALIYTVPDIDSLKPNRLIGVEDLRHLEDELKEADYFILHGGWSRYWGREEYFRGYPTLTEEAAEWLCGFGLKGIGTDAISVDTIEHEHLPVHRVILGSGNGTAGGNGRENVMKERTHDNKGGPIILENLCNLESIGKNSFQLSCLPLKITDADGSPVRAVAVIS